MKVASGHHPGLKDLKAPVGEDLLPSLCTCASVGLNSFRAAGQGPSFSLAISRWPP